MSDPMATVTGETLDGVSATTLWTLRNRATEAKRPDGVISDPWAITLFESITNDYSKFGRHSPWRWRHPKRQPTVCRHGAEVDNSDNSRSRDLGFRR